MPSKYEPYKESILSGEFSNACLAITIGCSESAIRTAKWKLLNPEKNREYKKAWRKRNSQKDLSQTRRYQEDSKKNNWNTRKPYSPEEDELIMSRAFKDKITSAKMGRPLSCIWTRRHKIKKNKSRKQ